MHSLLELFLVYYVTGYFCWLGIMAAIDHPVKIKHLFYSIPGGLIGIAGAAAMILLFGCCALVEWIQTERMQAFFDRRLFPQKRAGD